MPCGYWTALLLAAALTVSPAFGSSKSGTHSSASPNSSSNTDAVLSGALSRPLASQANRHLAQPGCCQFGLGALGPDVTRNTAIASAERRSL